MVQEILIDPKIIVKSSPVAGCSVTRKKQIAKLKLTQDKGTLNGNWDLTEQTIKNLYCYKDYLLFINNQKPIYQYWQKIYDSIKNKGYIQDPDKRYMEVGIGRTGEIFMVDGRHRLICAQELNIEKILVDVVYIHPDYNFGNLSYIKNEVIPRFIYNKIAGKWDEKIKVYHHWETINHRYNLVKNYLPLLKGLNVLEIGCNSGMMMWSILKHANALIEVEKQEKYFNQCKITSECLKDLHKGNIVLCNQSFKDFITNNKYDFNALYASFILYHLNDEEIELLKKEVLLKCKIVIIPNRQKERSSQINHYFLNRDNKIKKLLKSCGFKVTIDTSFDKGFSIIIGEKK